METTIKAATATEELSDDRFVRICSLLKSKNEHLPEECFQALEKEDYDTAFKILGRMQMMDTAFRLSMQRGLRILDEKKKIEQANREAEEAAKPKPAPEPEKKSFFKKVFGG